MATRTLTGAAEVKEAQGQLLGVGDWLPVDQDRVNAFASVTDDWQWIHVDPERAEAGPFRTTIAHGFLTLSLLPGLARSAYQFEGFSMKINYGLDRVRFPNPVPVGTQLRLRATLLASEDTPRGLRVKVHNIIEAEGSGAIACAADSIALLVP